MHILYVRPRVFERRPLSSVNLLFRWRKKQLGRLDGGQAQIIMDKKHQVFVSSTYEDLQPERQEVMHVLLELDCIPSGMELFPAANDSQWELIKGVIDDCDYYVVIIAGRYGSIGPSGISYTEMEYRYAVEREKPVVAFLHGDLGSIPSKWTEKSEEGKEKLKAFRDFVQQRVCKGWTTADGLGSVVSRSLVALRKSHPAVGWIRADQLPETTTAEILELRKKVDKLEGALQAARTQAPAGADKLAQGDELCEVKCKSRWGNGVRYSDTLSWDDILYLTLPAMMAEADESTVARALAQGVAKRVRPEIGDDYGLEVENDCLKTIIVQMRALGLIVRGKKQRAVKDTSAYWVLTPYGEAVMTRLRAIPSQRGELAKRRPRRKDPKR